MNRRFALLIGNSEYEDSRLAKLETPGADVQALAAALRNSEIGDFAEVTELINERESVIRRTITRFFGQKKPDDVVLLYFTGHGVLDDQGRLFLAVRDTEYDLLKPTAVAASFISDDMDHCRSRRQVLVLDCCHSGAFMRGGKGAVKAITHSTFEGNGYGRVVLTASDSTQYALPRSGEAVRYGDLSLFSHYLLEGLLSGAADRLGRGWITVDDWYDFAFEKVTSEMANQTPCKWTYSQRGSLIIAKNRARATGSEGPWFPDTIEFASQPPLEWNSLSNETSGGGGSLHSADIREVSDSLEPIINSFDPRDREAVASLRCAKNNVLAAYNEKASLEEREVHTVVDGIEAVWQSFVVLLDGSRRLQGYYRTTTRALIENQIREAERLLKVAEVHCPDCESVYPAEFRFCRKCGRGLKRAVTASHIELLKRQLRNYNAIEQRLEVLMGQVRSVESFFDLLRGEAAFLSSGGSVEAFENLVETNLEGLLAQIGNTRELLSEEPALDS